MANHSNTIVNSMAAGARVITLKTNTQSKPHPFRPPISPRKQILPGHVSCHAPVMGAGWGGSKEVSQFCNTKAP